MKVSLLVPAYNERENVEPLLRSFARFIKERNLDWELVLVDDGSTDGTYEVAEKLKKRYPFLKLLRHKRNYGKSEALLTGARAASGDIVVIYDADMQFTLADAQRLAELLERENLDIVAGRKRGKYEKKFVSSVYNALSRWLFKIPVHDMNAMKALRREILLKIPMRKDWHRYIIPLAHDMGYRIGEADVKLLPRKYGKSKYSNPFRIFIGFFDLVAVKFQLTFMRKPMLFFGSLGLISLFLGFLVGVVALYLRYIRGVGYRPLLYLVILFVLAGLILFTMGLLGELIAGLYDRLEKLEKGGQK